MNTILPACINTILPVCINTILPVSPNCLTAVMVYLFNRDNPNVDVAEVYGSSGSGSSDDGGTSPDSSDVSGRTHRSGFRAVNRGQAHRGPSPSNQHSDSTNERYIRYTN